VRFCCRSGPSLQPGGGDLCGNLPDSGSFYRQPAAKELAPFHGRDAEVGLRLHCLGCADAPLPGIQRRIGILFFRVGVLSQTLCHGVQCPQVPDPDDPVYFSDCRAGTFSVLADRHLSVCGSLAPSATVSGKNRQSHPCSRCRPDHGAVSVPLSAMQIRFLSPVFRCPTGICPLLSLSRPGRLPG